MKKQLLIILTIVTCGSTPIKSDSGVGAGFATGALAGFAISTAVNSNKDRGPEYYEYKRDQEERRDEDRKTRKRKRDEERKDMKRKQGYEKDLKDKKRTRKQKQREHDRSKNDSLKSQLENALRDLDAEIQKIEDKIDDLDI